jgi:hypothetical protein
MDDNTCITLGWKKDLANNYCVEPTSLECLKEGAKQCSSNETACAFYYGYVKSSTSDDCVEPTRNTFLFIILILNDYNY